MVVKRKEFEIIRDKLDTLHENQNKKLDALNEKQNKTNVEIGKMQEHMKFSNSKLEKTMKNQSKMCDDFNCFKISTEKRFGMARGGFIVIGIMGTILGIIATTKSLGMW